MKVYGGKSKEKIRNIFIIFAINLNNQNLYPMIKKTLLTIAAAAAVWPAMTAKVILPSLIGDNMVLQQQSDARLWGKADPSSKIDITTSWDGKTYTTYADRTGEWCMAVRTPAASSEPSTITFDDGDKTVIGNVLIGEVWYCSGQSNMEIPVRGYKHQPIEGSLQTIIHAKADKPIRMFTVEKGVSSTPLDSCGGHWGLNTPAEVAECSATAYFFAEEINEMLDNVPVGLIISVWGGTDVQPWMSAEAAAKFDLKYPTPTEPVDRSTPEVLRMASTLYNSMAAPVLPYTIKGMLWYQGENNCYDPEEYEKLMPEFVKCMRDGFQRPDMPFYYVQIAPFGGYGNVEHNVAKQRLVQSRLMNQTDNCGMAVTMDIGDRDCIHPANKREVGRRLAYWALAKDYGKNDFAYSGPIFNRMEWDGKRAILWFDNTGGGVSPLEVDLAGFEAAGEDGVWHRARGRVECETGTLSVYCDEIGEIKAVRYGHLPYFEATLFDNFGLPASPFVTNGRLE